MLYPALSARIGYVPHSQALQICRELFHGQNSPSEIGPRVGVTTEGVRKILDRLCSQGYVRRTAYDTYHLVELPPVGLSAYRSRFYEWHKAQEANSAAVKSPVVSAAFPYLTPGQAEKRPDTTPTGRKVVQVDFSQLESRVHRLVEQKTPPAADKPSPKAKMQTEFKANRMRRALRIERNNLTRDGNHGAAEAVTDIILGSTDVTLARLYDLIIKAEA